MNIFTSWWDRLRNGPALRAANGDRLEMAKTAEALRNEIRTRDETLALAGDALRSRDARIHMLTEFVRTLKARCSLCGSTTWQWEAVPVPQDAGPPILQAVCTQCHRRTMREEERRKAAAGPEVAPVEPVEDRLAG